MKLIFLKSYYYNIYWFNNIVYKMLFVKVFSPLINKIYNLKFKFHLLTLVLIINKKLQHSLSSDKIIINNKPQQNLALD